MTKNNVFLDSNIWLGYFLESSPGLSQLIESPHTVIFSSILSFHEVAKVLSHKQKSQAFVKEVLRYMRENTTVLSLNEDLVVDAVNWRLKNKLHAIDSILYQSALNSDALFITADSDFDGMPNVEKVKG